jgi:hypothetical protein
MDILTEKERLTMKIIGKVTVHESESSYWIGIKLKVKFKLPNKLFSITREKTITTSAWIGEEGYKDWDEYFTDCVEKLQDRELLEDEGKKMIIKYLRGKYKETEKDKSKRKINDLIASVNNQKFTVEVEYEDAEN